MSSDRKNSQKAYRAAAQRTIHRDGEIEIDNHATVSAGDDPGAYVAAWVWISDDTIIEEDKI